MEFCYNKGMIPKHSRLIQDHNQIELPFHTPVLSENGKWQMGSVLCELNVLHFQPSFRDKAVSSRATVIKLLHILTSAVWLVKVQKGELQPQS